MSTLAIVMPVKDTPADYLARAVQSVRSQSALSASGWQIELIVVDDGSTRPDTLACLASLSGDTPGLAIRVVRNGAPGGVSRARNLGIETAASCWVAFLDADDILLENSLADRIQVARMFPDAQCITSDIFHWHAFRDEPFPGQLQYRNTPLISRLRSASNSTLEDGESQVMCIGDAFSAFFTTLPVHTNILMARKALLLQAGLFDCELRRGQDVHLWMKLGLLSSFHYLDKPTAVYRIDQAAHARMHSDNFQYVAAIYAKLQPLLAQRRHRSLCRARLHQVLLDHAHFNSQRGKVWGCWRAYVRAVAAKPLSRLNIKYLPQLPLSVLRKVTAVG